jgi:ubiquitin-like 1-activating enzyme E1 A
MRNAAILVVKLSGVATEAIKNMVLAGIGRLVVVDGENVSEEDLGAGFFFRDDDVGQKVGMSTTFSNIASNPVQRLIAAKPRIESLNPLVAVEVFTDVTIKDEQFDRIISSVDLVCATDLDRDSLVRPFLCRLSLSDSVSF